MPSSSLLLLPLLPLLLLLFPFLLILFRFDAVPFLHLSETKRVRHECLVSGGLLLFDREEGVFADLSSNVASIVGVLDGDEILM